MASIRTLCIFAGWSFLNPPKDAEGIPITDERILKRYLNGLNPIKVNGGNIYVVQNSREFRDFGFAERGTFEEGVVQSSEEFSRSGLARVLEHASGKEAENL